MSAQGWDEPVPLLKRGEQLLEPLFVNGIIIYKITYDRPQPGIPCKSSPRGVLVILREVRKQLGSSMEDLVNDLRRPSTSVKDIHEQADLFQRKNKGAMCYDVLVKHLLPSARALRMTMIPNTSLGQQTKSITRF